MYSFTLQPLEIRSEAFERWLTDVRRAYTNGGAFAAMFSCEPMPSVTRSVLERVELTDAILKHPATLSALPGVVPPTGVPIDTLPMFEASVVFAFDADLAAIAHFGGAYGKGMSGAAAKRLSAAIVGDLFEDRWEDLEYACTNQSWSGWFHDGGYDATLLVVDHGRSTVLLIVATDTD